MTLEKKLMQIESRLGSSPFDIAAQIGAKTLQGDKIIMEAKYDLSTAEYLMVRCPYCNAWDRALDYYEGEAKCEVCGEIFHVTKQNEGSNAEMEN